MVYLTIGTTDGKGAIPLPETATIESMGLKHEVDFRKFTLEGWKVYIVRGLRYFTDGAPLIPSPTKDPKTGDTIEVDAKVLDAAMDKRRAAVDRKIRALYGEEPIRTQRASGDPIARELAGLLVGYLVAKRGLKVKEVPALGATVTDVTEKAKGLKVPKAVIDKAVKLATENVERERAAREALLA